MTDEKLLIIDDEVEFASTLCQRLKLRGFDATDAHSGAEGLSLLNEIEPGIVILDLKMLDTNGLHVLSEIKKYDPTIEVIMLTGHGSAGSGVEAMKKGAFDYLMKPIELNDLLEKIELADKKRNNSLGKSS